MTLAQTPPVAESVEATQADREANPIPMILHCPECHLQHIDEPTPEWDNPPHRSHLCHGCGCIWRPADVPTEGVRHTVTRGKADTWFHEALACQHTALDISDREDIARILFDQRQTQHDFDDAEDAPDSDAGCLRSICFDDADAVLALFQPSSPRHRLASYEAGRAEGVREAAEVADQIARFAKHKGLCAVVGGYGYCDCGRDAAVESLRALSKEPTK